MQWRKKRRLLYVIGSANHALLIKQYRDNGDSLCSTNDDEGDGDPVSSSPTTPVNGSWSNGRPAFSPRGPAKLGKQRLGYQQPSYRQHPQRGGYNDSKPPAVTTEKKTFNEEEYTKITTPRQDVLFKKGYLGRKKPALTNATNSADTNTAPSTEVHQYENAGVTDHEPIEPPDTPHFLCTNGYVDQGGVYYINGGSYELYDPYTGSVTVVVGPAPHGPPVLAAVSCQPVPLQPLEWFNPPFHHSYVSAACPDRRKRSSTDSQNWSPQSSESTDPPGSPQEGEDVGLQNGVVEHLEDCTVYQPPTYVYPGYMFGPAVYNMNGINIQGLPPQPQSIDISGSKRRKKKRRRRRRRGGVDDGSEESTSDENELEEPGSLTSQESSQEVESDSKNSAGSTGCKVGSGETNSSEKISEPTSNLTDTTSVNLLEIGSYVQSADTNSPNVKPQVVVDEYSRSSESERSEGNKDTPITNSCVSDFTTKTVNSVSQHKNCHEINEVPLSKSHSETIPVQNSCDENTFNGPTKTEKCSLECNNTANPIDCLTATTNVIQNSLCNSTDRLGINNTVTTKERSKGKRTSKSSKQRQQQQQQQQQQQHNHTDCAEVQLAHVQVQTVQQKMDGNEYSKHRGSNNGTDRAETSNETQFKMKSVSNRPDQAKTSGATRATSSGDTAPNEPPKKPLRKECSQQQKQVQKKLPSSVHKERKDRVGATKTSKNQPQYCSEESSENQVTSSEGKPIKPSQHSDECEIRSSFETGICTEVSAASECITSSPAVKSDSDQLKHVTPLYNVEEVKECRVQGKEFQYGSDESNIAEGTSVVPNIISRRPPKVESSISEVPRGNGDSASSVNIKLSNEEVSTCVTASSYSKTPENGKEEMKEYAMNMEEGLSPPPIPPPRRKKWHPCNKRPSTERPPTPGRDLEDRRTSEVLTDDSSSTSTSRESEESVIEIVSSTQSAKFKSLSLETQHSSEGEEGVICDTQHFWNTSSETQLQTPVSETRITPQKYDSLYEANAFPSHVPVKEKNSSYGIAQQLPDVGQNTHTPTPNLQLNDSIQQQKTFRQPLDGSTQEQTYNKLVCNNLDNLSLERQNYVICMSSVEKFSDDMASRVMEEALFAIKISKSDQAFSWPITEAVTRWLRSQSTEEVLPVPELRDSESDLAEDVEEESTKGADVIQENIAGPKNVLRNPLPALLHECNCTGDDVGIRVATNKLEFKHLKTEDCSNLTDTSNNVDKTHDINNNNKRAINVLKEMDRNDDGSDTCPTKLCEDDLLNTINAKKDSWQEVNYNSSVQDAEIAFSSLQDDGDSIITGESIEYDADWECDAVTLKLYSHVNDNNDTNPSSESPDCRCLHMCDPALSVAKYYRLGPQTDKADVIGQDHCVESEEEIGPLEHFRGELYDSAYDCSHHSLADELEFCEKPLPESWSIDIIKLSPENTDATCDILKMKYADCMTSDSGIQSEESGNEDSRKPSTNTSSIFSNSSKLFNRNSAIHMTGITSEGPFPCGGICCILQ